MSSSHALAHSLPSSPTSSAASSPSLGPCDSSPPSSPTHEPLSLSPPASPGVAHPYAASTKAVRPPRLYSKDEAEDGMSSISFNIGALEDPESPTRDDHTTSSRALLGTTSSGWGLPAWESTSRAERRTVSFASISSSDALEPPPRFLRGRVSRELEEESIDLSDEEDTEDVFGAPRKSLRELEDEKWDDVITRAVDRADGIIDLSNSGVIGTGLTRIPASICEWRSTFTPPSAHTVNPSPEPPARTFTRAHTMPANPHLEPSFLSDNTRLVKSPSVAHLRQVTSEEHPKVVNDLCLYLARNVIAKLPLELFSLQGLTVLNLRGNALRCIPPQIVTLKRLRILLLAQNKLAYLPAEMLNMHLDQLTLKGNPWREPPQNDAQIAVPTEDAPTDPEIPTRSLRPRIVSPITEKFTIPSLGELCLRTLLSSHRSRNSADARHGTVLQALRDFPLPEELPESIVRDLRVCCPGAVAKPEELMRYTNKRARRASQGGYSSVPVLRATRSQANEEDDEAEAHPGLGNCMSPVHQGAQAVFIRHAEERFTWERVVAGLNVDVDGGVPVLWRGCSRGCLNFLDTDRDAQAAS